MHRRRVALGTLLSLVVLTSVHVRSAEQILIAAGSAWKYNDTGTNLGTAWRAAAYNDARWATGSAQLGYGDGDEATVLSYGSNTSNRHITYYFRRSFTVANPAAISALTVRFVRDDGARHLPERRRGRPLEHADGHDHATPRCATTAIGGADESAWQQAPIDPGPAGGGHQRDRGGDCTSSRRRAPTSASISSCAPPRRRRPRRRSP